MNDPSSRTRSRIVLAIVLLIVMPVLYVLSIGPILGFFPRVRENPVGRFYFKSSVAMMRTLPEPIRSPVLNYTLGWLFKADRIRSRFVRQGGTGPTVTKPEPSHVTTCVDVP